MESGIEINDGKAQLSACVEKVEKTGTPLTIFRDKKPVARLIPHKASDPLIMDPTLKGAFFVDDPTAPLPDSDWPEVLR